VANKRIFASIVANAKLMLDIAAFAYKGKKSLKINFVESREKH
jgi:hypothetical protein